jgi:serine/threonine protein kinase
MMQPEANATYDFSHDFFLNLDDQANRNIYKIKKVDELYEFFEMIGEGSFSKVYRAKFRPTGQIMAVKVSN